MSSVGGARQRPARRARTAAIVFAVFAALAPAVGFVLLFHDRPQIGVVWLVLGAAAAGALAACTILAPRRNDAADFRSLVDGATEGIYVRRGLTFLYANQACASMFGFDSPEDVLNLESTLHLHPVSYRDLARGHQQNREAGGDAPVMFEIPGIRRDGTEFWIEQCASPITWGGAPAVMFSVKDVTARRTMEHAYWVERERLRAFIDHSPAMISLVDGEGRFVLANRAWRAAFDTIEGDLAPRLVTDTFSPEVAKTLSENNRLVLATGKPVQFEIDVDLPAGGAITVLVNKFPVEGGDGTTIGTISTDITERKRMVSELSAREERLRAIFDHAGMGICEVGLDGRFLDANPRFCAIVARSREALRGSDFVAISDNDSKDDVRRELWRLTSGAAKRVEFGARCFRPDGSPVWLDVTASSVQETDTKPRYVVAVCYDVSERRRAEIALRDSEERFVAVIDSMESAVVVKDLQGRYEFANRAFLRQFDASRDAVLGKTVFDVMPQDQANRMAAMDRDVIRKRRSISLEFEGVKGDGSRHTYIGARFPIFDAEGRVRGTGVVTTDISPRKAMEEALRQSEERFRAIYESAAEGIVEIGMDGAVLDVNPRLCDILSRPREEIIGTPIDHFSGEECKGILRDRFAAMVSGRQYPSGLETRFVAPDGSSVWCSLNTVVLDGGEQKKIVSIVNDITERHVIQEALAASERNLRGLFENMSDVFWRVDMEGRVTLVSPSLERMLRFKPDAIVGGRIVPKLVAEAEWTRLVRELEGNGGRIENFELTMTRGDGRTIIGEVNAAFHFDRSGNPTGIEGVVRDVTERRSAGEWVQRLSAAIEQNPQSVIIMDSDGAVEYANPYMRRQTGFSMGDIVGQSIMRFIVGGIGDSNLGEIEAAFHNREQWRGEVFFGRKNAAAFQAAAFISPIRDPSGKVTNWLGVFEDITARVAMEGHLRQAQKMEAVGQLTGGVAHDFNNILAVIMTNAELVGDLLPEGNDRLQAMTDAILRAVKRGASLTERLLAFSRRQDLHPEVLDLSHLVPDLGDMLRRTLGENIAIHVQLDADLPPVFADHGQFENAILNLSLNARDAMPDGGSLTIAASLVDLGTEAHFYGLEPRAGAFVCVSVADDGIGMAPEVALRIFEPFFTTKAQGQGTGLGLSMVYGFVTQSGGEIAVESEEGVGTVIRMFLPIADSAQAAAKGGDKTVVPQVDVPPATILLVEDDPAVRDATYVFLKNMGHHVLEAGDGNAALGILRTRSDIDLLFTDVIMPGGFSGRDLAEAARAITPEMKVLFTSGYAAGRLSAEDLRDEHFAFIAKPFSRAALTQVLQRLLVADAPG